MTDPVFPVSAPPAIIEKDESKYSRSTIAHINDVADKLVSTKKSMLDDMSRGYFKTASDAAQAIMDLQAIQAKVQDLKKHVQEKSASDFSPKDIDTIESMKREGKSEEKIANLFDTNQTKINRLRNGKIKLSE